MTLKLEDNKGKAHIQYLGKCRVILGELHCWISITVHCKSLSSSQTSHIKMWLWHVYPRLCKIVVLLCSTGFRTLYLRDCESLEETHFCFFLLPCVLIKVAVWRSTSPHPTLAKAPALYSLKISFQCCCKVAQLGSVSSVFKRSCDGEEGTVILVNMA